MFDIVYDTAPFETPIHTDARNYMFSFLYPKTIDDGCILVASFQNQSCV